MTINTKSSFIFDFVIDSESTYLNFDEGSIELTAQLEPDSYSMQGMANEVARALNNTGALTYTCTVDRTTRVFTISADGVFNLLCNTGSNVGLSGWEIFGFSTAADRTGLTTYDGDNPGGKIFTPQFLLQDYISFNDWQGFASSSVNESASGVTEVYSLGSRQFAQFNITLQNNGLGGVAGQILEYDANGVGNLRDFMQFAITKGPIEMMEDRDLVSVYDTMILESTSKSKNGTEFQLKELYNRNLTGWFESGKLKFRKQD